MTSIAIDRPQEQHRTEHSAARPERLFEPPGGESTLEDLILSVWEDLARGLAAECPVCGAEEMRLPEPDAELATCGRCGSELS